MSAPGDAGPGEWGPPGSEPGGTGWPPPPLWPPSAPRGRSVTWRPANLPPPYGARPHAVPAPFHHLLRTPRWRWWRPLVGLPVLAMLWLLANVLLIGVAALGTRATGTDLELFTGSGQDTGPAELLAANLTLALLIPSAALAVLVVHRERPGWLSSVTGRLRWVLLWRFTLLATGTTVVGYAGFALVPGLAEAPAESLQRPDSVLIAVLLAVTWLSTPLQAAAEEYAFRGYLTQAVAGLIPGTTVSWCVAGALSSTVFALAHGTQDPGLFASRLFFGIVATWTVARTGGLEAAIALHAVNNVVVLSIAVSTGALSETLTASDLPWRYALVDMAATAAFGVLVGLWARRLRPERVSAAVLIPYADAGGQAPGRSAAFFGPHEQIG